MCLELRQQLVNEGLAPLPPHRLVIRDQERSLSPSFTLSLPDLNVEQCHRVFFPGCNLSAYSPSLVLKTYHYLQERLPGTGIILGCCGSPTRELGQQQKFQEIVTGIESMMKELGASEMILACPYCYYTLKEYEPWFQLKSIYEVMVEVGLPEVVPNREWTFSLHDSCRARWEKNLQDAVRTLVRRMGYRIKEMEYSRDKTRCCGMGGEILFTGFDLAIRIIKRRIEEAPFDMLTYCASCRETFASQGKPCVHILDLIFNPNWDKDRLKPPNKASMRRGNQSFLK
jgi:Fe-S oxidoreductase